jgi:hypothetical protein
MKFAAPVTPAQHIERLALKGMALTNDCYSIGIAVEVVGSLSSGPSIRSAMIGWSASWSTASAMHA